jgi:inner membrane protein
MPSVVSHPAVPLALATMLPHEVVSPSVVFLGMVCSTIPDLDVVGFKFGVPREHVLAHRGLSHSIAFAVCLSGCLTWLLSVESQELKASSLTVFFFLCLSTLSHGLLDAMTNGGSDVAFFAPFHHQRYFLPWRPIHVSPITVSGFFSARGVRVLRSELRWIWMPAAGLAIFATLLRRLG